MAVFPELQSPSGEVMTDLDYIMSHAVRKIPRWFITDQVRLQHMPLDAFCEAYDVNAVDVSRMLYREDYLLGWRDDWL